MSKRYSIDAPGVDNDSDLEEDIVLGNFRPTTLDRDLLRADEAVLNDLNQKSKSKRSFFSRSGRGGQYTRLSAERPAKKKVGFAGSKPAATKPSGKSGNKSRSGYAQLNNDGHPQNSEDSDSDYPSDIEIDIRVQPRRSELRQRVRKLHGLLVIILVLLGIWFVYNNVLPFGRSQKGPTQNTLLSNGTHEFRPTTVVISLDGFHPHYINDQVTPHLHNLFTQNSGAPYMTPSFPSSTFPNHWTMVTGLYPSQHGIVGNTFFDESLNKQFFNTKPAQSLNQEFWGGQPIWQTASFQGVLSAIHMWPGSEVEWNSEAPILVDKFNSTELLSVKSDRVLSWLDRDVEERPELIMTYVPTVDSVGHAHGISGKELIQALKDVDRLVGDIIEGFASRNLTDIVNLVVVSDHGMAPTSNDRLIYLDDLVEMDNIEHVDGWPLLGLRPKSSIHIQALYENLKEAQSQFGENKWDVYLREELPKDWKFGGSGYNQYKSRIAPLWLIPRVGWAFTTKEQMKKLGGDYKPHGIHGYNNTEVLMRALFVAQGPYFSNDLYVPFENVGLYNILCDTLGIQPAQNNGPSVKSLLKSLPSNWTDQYSYPGVPFKTEILDINSTYDTLFGIDEASFEEIESNAEVHEEPSSNVAHVSPALPTPTGSASLTTGSVLPSETASSDKASSDKEEDTKKDPSWLQSWYDYAKSAASSAKSWMADKYKSLTGSKDDKSKDDSKDAS